MRAEGGGVGAEVISGLVGSHAGVQVEEEEAQEDEEH